MAVKFELEHVGINCSNPEEAKNLAELLSLVFNLTPKMGNSSNFGGPYFECMKKIGRGTNGHIAMRTSDVDAAVAELKEKGYNCIMETASYHEDGTLKNIYMEGEFGGFAIHIIKR